MTVLHCTGRPVNIMCEVEVQTYLSCQPSGPLPVCKQRGGG